jgi:hypothetical protein
MQEDRARELAAARPAADFRVEIGEDHVAHFRRHGFTWIERITSDEELAWLGDVYDWLFGERTEAVPGGYFDLARPYESGGPDLLPQILLPEARLPELRETAFWRNGLAFAAVLLEGSPERLRGWGHMIRKPARVGSELPWHQDEAYWDPRFDYRALGCWMTLDRADRESGCLRFLPGSHRGEVRRHRHVGDDPRVHALAAEGVDDGGAVDVPLSAGGAVFHHCRMLHASWPNRSARVRRGYANEWQLPPVRRERPFERPWVDDGKRAWDARDLGARGRAGGAERS